MDLKTAKRHLQEFIDYRYVDPLEERHEALSLGIEALERVELSRTWQRPDPRRPLPSETNG